MNGSHYQFVIMKKLILLIPLFMFFISCISVNVNLPKTDYLNSFLNEEAHLILASDTLTPMRIYKITDKNDSLLLRKHSSYVSPNINDALLQTFVKRLYRTVIDSMSLGVGIAAPQVGILKNIIWVQRFDKENFPFEVYLNPIIVQ